MAYAGISVRETLPADANNYKRARHPNEFFPNPDDSEYWASYDFIPDPKDQLLGDPLAFVTWRKQLMLAALENLYGLKIMPSDDELI